MVRGVAGAIGAGDGMSAVMIRAVRSAMRDRWEASHRRVSVDGFLSSGTGQELGVGAGQVS